MADSLGNGRYIEYMKDIRASGQRVISFIDDMVDLSRIETGKLDLAFTNQNLDGVKWISLDARPPVAPRTPSLTRGIRRRGGPAVRKNRGGTGST